MMYEVHRFTRSREVLDDNENCKIGEDSYESMIILVPYDDKELEDFGEWLANEMGDQDYGNIIRCKKIALLSAEEIRDMADQLSKKESGN